MMPDRLASTPRGKGIVPLDVPKESLHLCEDAGLDPSSVPPETSGGVSSHAGFTDRQDPKTHVPEKRA